MIQENFSPAVAGVARRNRNGIGFCTRTSRAQSSIFSASARRFFNSVGFKGLPKKCEEEMPKRNERSVDEPVAKSIWKANVVRRRQRTSNDDDDDDCMLNEERSYLPVNEEAKISDDLLNSQIGYSKKSGRECVDVMHEILVAAPRHRSWENVPRTHLICWMRNEIEPKFFSRFGHGRSLSSLNIDRMRWRTLTRSIIVEHRATQFEFFPLRFNLITRPEKEIPISNSAQFSSNVERHEKIWNVLTVKASRTS